jgi:hypothetical protein
VGLKILTPAFFLNHNIVQQLSRRIIMKTIIASLALSFIFQPFARAADFNLDSLRPGDITGIPVLAELPSASPDKGFFDFLFKPKAKEWTVMIFMNGKNNLEVNGVQDLNELERIGSTKDLNIVVEYGRIEGYDDSNGDWKGAKVFYVQKDTDTAAITSPVIKELPKSDMGSWKQMAEFVKFAKARYPARRYLLGFWNHGSGWQSDGKPIEGDKGVCYDDETGNHITTIELGRLFAAIGKMDVVTLDACLMADVSVFYQMRRSADVIVASEETEPVEGYDYTALVRQLAENPSVSNADIGRNIVNTYIASLPSEDGITQSAVRVSAMYPLVRLMDGFAGAALNNSAELPALKAAAAGTPSFSGTSVDLYELMLRFKAAAKDEDLKYRAQLIMNFIKERAVILSREQGHPTARGIAAYIPMPSYDEDFSKLDIARDTRWDDLAKALAGPAQPPEEY